MEFPPSKSQNKYWIVLQDLFTRWVELKPVRSADGKTIAKAFEELILFRWETPDYLLTDNGNDFDNKLVMDMLDRYGVQHAPIPPHHAQADPVERANETLKTPISMYVKADQREWDAHIHAFRHSLNTAMQSTTKVSPAFLNFRRHPRPVKILRREVETQSQGPQFCEVCGVCVSVVSTNCCDNQTAAPRQRVFRVSRREQAVYVEKCAQRPGAGCSY